MSYREVIVGGAILCAIVGFFVVLSMAAEPWLGSDQSSVTRVIQLALTPAFLLTAVAALLNVFSTRLGRVADRVDLLSRVCGLADTRRVAELGRVLINAQIAVPLWGHVPR
jgi:apolipoprotein N-acyltransferase